MQYHEVRQIASEKIADWIGREPDERPTFKDLCKHLLLKYGISKSACEKIKEQLLE